MVNNWVNNFVGLFIIFLPRVVLFRVPTLHNVIVSIQNIFLGVLSVVSMTTTCGKGSYSRWCDEEMNTNTPLPLLCFILFNTLWKFLWLGNLAWDILGVKFWSGDFGSFDFCPHSIIPDTLNSEYTPLPSVPDYTMLVVLKLKRDGKMLVE